MHLVHRDGSRLAVLLSVNLLRLGATCRSDLGSLGLCVVWHIGSTEGEWQNRK